MKFRLPTPENWQDFEFICHQLWKDIWGDVNAQRHGRVGQKQYGVDVYGYPLYTKKLAAVQCKDKDGLLVKSLTKKELLSEAGKAKGFNPEVNSFTLATTAPRDEKIQAAVRALNIKKTYPFEINVWSWPDIADEILARPLILNNYWKNFSLDQTDFNSVVNINSTNDKFHAFFSRNFFIEALPDKTRNSIRKVIYELADNALSHGRATQVELSFKNKIFCIKDDGAEFNPLIHLDRSKASLYSHAGSKEVHDFIDEYAGNVNFKYSFLKENDISKNIVEIELDDSICKSNKSDSVEIVVGEYEIFNRESARNLIASKKISKSTKKISVVIPSDLPTSSKYELLIEINNNVNPDCEMRISCAERYEQDEIEKMVKQAGMKFNVSSRN